MLLSVFGTPSALTYAGCTIVRAIADCVAGSHAFIQGVFLDDVKKAWTSIDRSKTPVVVLFSDCPATPLIELIRSARVPVVVLVDGFAEIVHHSLETRGMSVVHALRFASQVVCTLDRFKDQNVLFITPKSCRRSIEDFASAVCELYGLQNAEATTNRVLARLGYDDRAPTLGEYFARNQPRLVSDQSTAMRDDPHDRALIEHVADQYAGVGTGHGRSEIFWPAELFLDWDKPGAFLSGPINLLGPARFIICGPYLHLFAGQWVVNIVIEVAENLSGNRLGVDVFSGKILNAVAMNLPTEGVFKFAMTFRVEDPFLPVELRFQILTGAIEGKLMLGTIGFRRENE